MVTKAQRTGFGPRITTLRNTVLGIHTFLTNAVAYQEGLVIVVNLTGLRESITAHLPFTTVCYPLLNASPVIHLL